MPGVLHQYYATILFSMFTPIINEIIESSSVQSMQVLVHNALLLLSVFLLYGDFLKIGFLSPMQLIAYVKYCKHCEQCAILYF